MRRPRGAQSRPTPSETPLLEGGGGGGGGGGVGAGVGCGVGTGVVLSGGGTPVDFIALQPLVCTHTATLTTCEPKFRFEQPWLWLLAS